MRKKGIIVFVLTLVLSLSLMMTGLSAFAAGASDYNTGEGTDFTVKNNAGATYDAVTNTQDVWVLSSWQHSAIYKNKVDLTDLELEFKFKDLAKGQKFGFGFAISDDGWYWNTDNAITALVDSYPLDENNAQISYRITKNHDPSTAFTKEDGSAPSRYALNNYVASSVLTVKFSSKLITEEGENKGKFMITYSLSGQPLALPADAPADGTVVYLTKEQLFGAGEIKNVNMFLGAMDAQKPQHVTVVKMNDKNNKAAIAAADTAVTAYENAVVTNIEGALNSRKLAGSEITKVSVMHRSALLERLAAKDEVLKANAAFVTGVVAEIEKQVVATETATNLFTDETEITTENISLAENAVKAVDKTLYYFVTGAEAAAFDARIDAAKYQIEKAKIMIEVIAYESLGAACEAEKTAANILLAEAKGAIVADISLDALNETDRVAMTARILANDEAIAAIKEEIADQFAGYYMTQYEQAVALIDIAGGVNVDAITVTMIKNASDAKALVIFDETHADYADLNTRFAAANVKLEKAATDVYTLKLNSAKTLLTDAEKSKDLKFYDEARDTFKEIDMSILDTKAETYADLLALYNGVKTNIEVSKLDGFANNGMVDAKLTDKGVKTSGFGTWPNRLNYNKPINMKDAKMVVSVDKYAYYNSETDNPDKGANNLAFNFLTKPNTYKGTDANSKGFTIMLWVFETQCNVQIYNYNDSVIASETISTPTEGGNVIIRIGLFDDMWIVKVNEAEIVIGNSELVGIDKNIFKQGEDYLGYFSVGSFSNDLTDPNIFTLKQLGETMFGNETFEFPEFEEEEVPDDDKDDDKDDDNKQEDKSNLALILGISIPCGVIVIGGGVFCIYWFMIRKRKQ